jgi:hypothetical protein
VQALGLMTRVFTTSLKEVGYGASPGTNDTGLYYFTESALTPTTPHMIFTDRVRGRRPPTHTSDSAPIDVHPAPTSLQFRVIYTYMSMHLYILGV